VRYSIKLEVAGKERASLLLDCLLPERTQQQTEKKEDRHQANTRLARVTRFPLGYASIEWPLSRPLFWEDCSVRYVRVKALLTTSFGIEKINQHLIKNSKIAISSVPRRSSQQKKRVRRKEKSDTFTRQTTLLLHIVCNVVAIIVARTELLWLLWHCTMAAWLGWLIVVGQGVLVLKKANTGDEEGRKGRSICSSWATETCNILCVCVCYIILDVG